MKFKYILLGSLLMLLLTSACRKESGFLPDYDPQVPYYASSSFEHQWSQTLEPGGEFDNIASLKTTSNLILLVSSRMIQAVSIVDGAPVWIYMPEPGNEILGDFEIIETPDRLMFFQKSGGGYFTVINKTNGAFIEWGRMWDLPGFAGSPVSVEKWNDKLYIFSIDRLAPGGSEVLNHIYKLDPVSRELTLLISVEGSNFNIYNTPILIDSNSSKLYATYKKRENGIYFLNFIEINLEDDTYRNVRIKDFSTDDATYGLHITKLGILDQMLLTGLDNDSGFAAIDTRDGSIIWTLPISEYHPYTNAGKIYLLEGRELISVDPDTGKKLWSAKDISYSDFNRHLVFHPNKAMALIKGNYNKNLSIYDLHDGSILGNLDVADMGDAIYIAGNSLYIESQDKIILATDDFTLHCFKWPFK